MSRIFNRPRKSFGYRLTSLTMPDPQTRDMRQIRQMMSALPLASARLSKL